MLTPAAPHSPVTGPRPATQTDFAAFATTKSCTYRLLTQLPGLDKQSTSAERNQLTAPADQYLTFLCLLQYLPLASSAGCSSLQLKLRLHLHLCLALSASSGSLRNPGLSTGAWHCPSSQLQTWAMSNSPCVGSIHGKESS